MQIFELLGAGAVPRRAGKRRRFEPDDGLALRAEPGILTCFRVMFLTDFWGADLANVANFAVLRFFLLWEWNSF